MSTDNAKDREQYVNKILSSGASKKVIVAGPGTGKTFTFGKYLEKVSGGKERKLVMTFINPLVDDLHSELGERATVMTFDRFVKKECEEHNLIRGEEKYYLNANEIISEDYEYVFGEKKSFSLLYNTLEIDNESLKVKEFVKRRNEFYKFVDPSFIKHLLNDYYSNNKEKTPKYDVVIIDEFQDFNKLEAEIVLKHLSENILLAGDDDQVLFEFKGSNPDCIRDLFNKDNDYESFTLPYCSRCPRSVVDFVNSVITYSNNKNILPETRCNKQYLPFREAEEGSIVFEQYSSESAHFSIESALKDIKERNASVLILYPYSAENEAERLHNYLTLRGFNINRKKKEGTQEVLEALDILSRCPSSNLGWRTLLPFLFEQEESRVKEIIKQCHRDNKNIFDVIGEEYKEKVQSIIPVVRSFQSSRNTSFVKQQDSLLELLSIKANDIKKADDRKNKIKDLKKKYLGFRLYNNLKIELCNIGNSKGLSADYVFIYPFSSQHFKLQDPKDVYNTIVAFTRTKKKLLIFEPKAESQKSEIKNLYEGSLSK